MSLITSLLAVLVGVVAATAVSPAIAHAGGGTLAVGMRLTINGQDCSLGFFATDSAGDQLAITAGHCASGLHDKVYNPWGQQIGEVVAWQPDAEDSRGKLTGSRGFTVIYTYRTFGIEPFFTRLGTAKVGDCVRLYGERTNGTNGRITDVSYAAGHPDLDVLTADLWTLPGDSGGPWYAQGPTLLGISSSYDDGSAGGARRTYAQPFDSVEREIKGVARYGQGFSVYVQG